MRTRRTVVGALFVVAAAYAQFNITVDDTNPALLYTPASAWIVISGTQKIGIGGAADPTYYFGGSEHATTTMGASVTLAFSYASHIYYITDLNVDHGPFIITLDGVEQPPMTTYSAAGATPQQLVFDHALDPTLNHTITVTNNLQGNFTAVDYFVYTVPSLNNVPSPSSSSSSNSASASSDDTAPSQTLTSPSPGPANASSNAGIIAASVLGGFIFSVLVGAGVFMACRRNRRQQQRWTVQPQTQQWTTAQTHPAYAVAPAAAGHLDPFVLPPRAPSSIGTSMQPLGSPASMPSSKGR